MGSLGDRDTVDATGRSVSFWVNQRTLAMSLVGTLMGGVLSAGLMAMGPLWSDAVVLTLVVYVLGLVAVIGGTVGSMLWLGRSLRRTVSVSLRSITVESAWFGRTGQREVFPLETMDRAEVRSLLGPIRSRLALVGTDGSRSEYLLGTHHDHVAVAEWLNGHLERVEQLESVDEVVPIELKRLSTASGSEGVRAGVPVRLPAQGGSAPLRLPPPSGLSDCVQAPLRFARRLALSGRPVPRTRRGRSGPGVGDVTARDPAPDGSRESFYRGGVRQVCTRGVCRGAPMPLEASVTAVVRIRV